MAGDDSLISLGPDKHLKQGQRISDCFLFLYGTFELLHLIENVVVIITHWTREDASCRRHSKTTVGAGGFGGGS